VTGVQTCALPISFEELCKAAGDALMNVMVDNLEAVQNTTQRSIHVESGTEEMLLFHLLDELVFYKDAEKLLLRIDSVRFEKFDGTFTLDAESFGEEIDPSRHQLIVDVKAVTLYRYGVEKTADGWKATVVLDI